MATETHLGVSFRLGKAEDGSSFVFEFTTTEGRQIGVAFIPQAIRALRAQIDTILEMEPDFGKGASPPAQ